MPAQLLAFYCERLLDLHDQLGVPIDGIGVCDDRRASGFVVAVWQARFGADASFYENPVTPVGEFADRRWYIPTRYSLSLISFGTPASTIISPKTKGAPCETWKPQRVISSSQSSIRLRFSARPACYPCQFTKLSSAPQQHARLDKRQTFDQP
jgi:hypothetical protein